MRFYGVFLVSITMLAAVAAPARASVLSPSSLVLVPKTAQQIIGVDYHSLMNTPNGQQIHDNFFPHELVQFESAIRAFGVTPERDINKLVFVTYRDEKGTLKGLAIAEGFFDLEAYKKGRQQRQTQLNQERQETMPVGFRFLDNSIAVFGDADSLKLARALYARSAESVANNSDMLRLIDKADDGLIWSVLDQVGSQEVIDSISKELSSAFSLAPLKNRIRGIYYSVSSDDAIKFSMNVVTEDAVTASVLSKALQLGAVARRMLTDGPERDLLTTTEIRSDASRVFIHAEARPAELRSLASTPLLSGVIQ